MSSDAWNEIQALKSKQSSLRAKLAARRKEREGIVAEITKAGTQGPNVPSPSRTASEITEGCSSSDLPVLSAVFFI